MRRILTVTALLGLLAAFLAAPVAHASTAAPAAPAVPPAEITPFAGDGSSELLHVNADLPVGDFAIAEVGLSPVSTSVNSTTDPRSTADAANLDGALLGGNIPLDGILVEVSQTAPPDNAEATEETLIPIPAEPLLDLGVSTSSAHARWPGDNVCLDPGVPLSRAFNETAGASVLTVPDTLTVATVNNQSGGVSGTTSQLTTELVPGEEGRALVSTSETQVDEVTILQGTPLEVSIGVVGTPTLTATASGQPGGATVTYDAPIITIEAPEGGALEPLEELGTALDDALQVPILGELVPQIEDLVNMTLGEAGILQIDYQFGDELLQSNTAADGTGAIGQTSVLQLTLTVLPAIGEDPLAQVSVDLGPMTASAAVPVGGINCNKPPIDNPLRDVHKDVSQGDVAPGGQFDYTLTIPNRGPCTLENVVVTDVIDGPLGEVSAEPEWDSRDGDTFTWNVGTLEPEETYTITMTIQVPDDAQPGEVFLDTLSATGECDGEPVGQERELELPEVTDEFRGPCELSLSNKAASHLEVIPGQTFNYFVHAFNRGAEPCTDVTVTDTLDDRLDFVSCTDDCTADGQSVVWSGETIPGGSGTTYTVTVMVKDDAEGTLENVAVIDSPDDEGGPVTVRHVGPDITDESILAPPNPPRLVEVKLARTGGNVPTVILVGLGLAGVAGLAARRRFVTG